MCKDRSFTRLTTDAEITSDADVQISNDFHSKAVWVKAVFGRDAKHLTENPSVQR